MGHPATIGERRREVGGLVVDELGAGWKLALVEDAGDEDASSVRPIEDDVLALLETAQPGGQLAAGPPDAWLLSKQIEAVQQQGEATAEIARNVIATASAANVMTTRAVEVSTEASDTGRRAAEEPVPNSAIYRHGRSLRSSSSGSRTCRPRSRAACRR